MKHVAFALLACSFASLAQTPAPKRPMTFADLAAMKRVSDPQISPSGKWVLFSVTDVSLEKNSKINHLWIVPLDGSAKERQLTSASGESNGRFSPDGKWVMFSHQDQIWLAPFDEAKGAMGDDHAVTALETGADGGIWAPDSQHIVFTSSVYPDCESRAPMGPQRDNEEANCNALKDAVAAKSPVQAQIFDHLLYRHWNAYVGAKHSHVFYAAVPTGGAPEAPTDLTPASVIGDHEAPTFSLGGPLGYAISPDGKEIAYVTNLDKFPAESTNNDIFTLQVGADPHTAKKVSTSPGSDDGPQYSPDGRWLIWRSQTRNGYESDKFNLVRYDRLTDGHESSILLKNFDGSVDEFAIPNLLVPTSEAGEVFFTSAEHGEESIFNLVFGPKNFTAVFKVKAGGELADIHPRAIDSFIATQMFVDRPAAIISATGLHEVKPDREGVPRELPARVESLTQLNKDILSQLSLSAMESFWFPGANGTRVQGFLVRPPNFDPAKKYPVKFLIHGGPQGAWGDAWSYRWNPELFAANGYVVVMVNPRGSTGYGQKFLEQVSGDWGGRSIEDLMKGLDYAEQHFPFIDKSRECALGASYGGFAANWLLTHTNRFKCIVTHDGMYNPQAAFGTTEELWFNEWEFRPLAKGATNPGAPSSRPSGAKVGSQDAGEAEPFHPKNPSSRPEREARSGETPVFAGADTAKEAVVEQTKPAHPWDFYDKPASQDPFRKWSPMLSIKNAHTPTLVVHGQRDYRLDVSEGFQLFTALQLLNVPSKMLYFPDEGHWVLKPKNSELWYETVNDWCDRWTGTNKYAGIGPERNPAAVVPNKPAALDKNDTRKPTSQHPDN